MRDFDEIVADAHPAPPFANGMEHEGWEAANCERCAYGTCDDCPIMVAAILGDGRPQEFQPGPRDQGGGFTIATQWVCTEFRQLSGVGESPTILGLIDEVDATLNGHTAPIAAKHVLPGLALTAHIDWTDPMGGCQWNTVPGRYTLTHIGTGKPLTPAAMGMCARHAEQAVRDVSEFCVDWSAPNVTSNPDARRAADLLRRRSACTERCERH
jgi:hypothetical protein